MYTIKVTHNDGNVTKSKLPENTEFWQAKAKFENTEYRLLTMVERLNMPHDVQKIELIGPTHKKKNHRFELRTFDAQGRML